MTDVGAATGGDPLAGTWASVLLPIGGDDAIDMRRLEGELEALLASGVHGVYTNGTAGEFYAQDPAEYRAIAALVAHRCRAADVPFQLGASDPTARETRRRVAFAATLRPAAVQVILPDWMPVSEPEAERYLTVLAVEADGLPLVLYNPPHAKTSMGPEAMARLHAAVPSLVGAKVAWSDPSWLPRMLRLAPGFRVFVPGHTLASERARGASGAYSNAACLHPAAAERWWAQMHRDPAGALDLEHRLGAFMRRYIVPLRDDLGVSNAALDKLLAAIGGWADIGTRLRWPYLGVPATAVGALAAVARREIPEFVGPKA